MIIAITGSSGFVGSALKKQLVKLNYEICEIDITDGFDLTDWESISGIDHFDLLIHLAAKSYVPDSFSNPVEFYKTNVIGTLHALELCRKHNARIIYTSSYVYGNPQYLPINEEHPVNAFNPYAQSKLMGENLCKAYHRDFNIPVIVLRPFNIYGKGQNDQFLIPMIISQAKKGKINLKDSRPKRDFIYIEDIVNAYIKSIEYTSSTFEIFNIGSGKSTSIQELTSIISKFYQNLSKITFSEKQRKNEVLETIADISKANRLLNWFPKYSIEEGIVKII